MLQIDPEDWRAYNNKGVWSPRASWPDVSAASQVLLKESGLLQEAVAAYALAIQNFHVRARTRGAVTSDP